MLLIIAVFGYQRFAWRKDNSAIESQEAAKSIAVLPFENLGQDADNAFFADGVQDDLVTSLGKVRELKVISRSSVMNYRDFAKRKGILGTRARYRSNASSAATWFRGTWPRAHHWSHPTWECGLTTSS